MVKTRSSPKCAVTGSTQSRKENRKAGAKEEMSIRIKMDQFQHMDGSESTYFKKA